MQENMPKGGDAVRRSYQREVHEDLHAVSWSHVSHVVKVSRIRNHLGSEFRIPEHLPATHTHTRAHAPSVSISHFAIKSNILFFCHH